jgi:hypothetical protein
MNKFNDLAQEIASGNGSKFFDLETGDVVGEADCPEGARGVGRPAVKDGKRFIKIPVFDDLCKSESKILEDKCSKLAKMVGHNRPGINPRNQEEWDLLWECSTAPDPYQEVARRWIASLQPPFHIALKDEDDFVVFEYHPETNQWTDY